MIRIIPYFKIYAFWDNCITSTFYYYEYSKLTLTLNLLKTITLYDLNTRVYWPAAHDPVFSRGSLVVWDEPFWSITPGENGMLTMTQMPDNVTNITNPVSYLALAGYRTEGLQAYVSSINHTTNGYVFLVAGENMTLLACSKAGVLPPDRLIPAIESPDDLTRQVALEWNQLPSTTQSFSLRGDSNILIDTALVPVTEGGAQFRVFLVTPESDFLGEMTDSRDSTMSLANWSLIGMVIWQGVVLLLSIVLAVFFAFQIYRPLSRVCKQLKRVTKMEFTSNMKNHFVSPHSSFSRLSRLTEVKQLQTETERMQTTITAFTKYVPTQVVHRLVNNDLKAEVSMNQAEATIMFLDLVDFTHLTETLGVQKVVLIMEKLFTVFTDIIEANEGTR